MSRMHGYKCEVVSRAGCVTLEILLEPGSVAISVMSPRGARIMAKHLLTFADDAEQWGAEEVDEEERGANRERRLDELDVARVDPNAAPLPRRKRAAKKEPTR